MEVPVERVSPGSELPLRGLDFFSGETRKVRMTGPGLPVDVGGVRAGPDGHFEQTVALPSALPPGLYTVDASSASGIINRAAVTIDPAAPPRSVKPLFARFGTNSEVPSADRTPLAALAPAIAGLATLLLRTRRSDGLR